MIIKSKLIFVLLLFLLLGAVAVAYKYFFVSEELPYDFVLVEKGNIVQRVSTTGQIVPVKSIDLQFEIQGKIREIKVKVGQEVKTGDALVVLDTTELNTNFLEAESARNVAQAKFDQVLAGASEEEIKVYETDVENVEIALNNAQIALTNDEQNLIDVQAVAQENLEQAYEDSLNTLDDSYLKLYNAYDVIDLFTQTYVTFYDQEGREIRENRDKIESVMNRAKFYLDIAKNDSTNENIDTALSEIKDSLNKSYKALLDIRDACEAIIYHNLVSATDKTSLDTQKSHINTALTNIIDDQQKIATQGITNQTNINTAQSELDTAQNAVTTAEGNLKSSQDKLTQIKAPPQEAGVNLVKAQLNQAEAALVRVRQQLAKASLTAPMNGTVITIKKEKGEIATIQEPVITMISLGDFQIEVDIPEADIGKVNLQDAVEISLDAFPEEIFSGNVIKIDPGETIIQGVVYYKITVGIDESDERTKSGMTANVDIITEAKEDVLIIPQRAVLTKNEQKMVRILEGEEIKEIKVETGLRGSMGKVEILSGLKEGDKVVTFLKQKND